MNPWITHCKAYQKAHPSLKWSEVLKAAKSSYTKVGKTKKMKGRGLGDDILSDIKGAKLGSKAVDYIKAKVEQGGYGKHTKRMM